jgi:Rps23 Pro-64 3,4-dihydroxylase Tpa1-like proline 4-hydroxylase
MQTISKPADTPDVLRAHYLVIDDFLPAELACTMRQDIEAHFGMPQAHQPQTHQIWNYWYVPGLYTYLRTTADRIIHRARMDQFMAVLGAFATSRLGLKVATRPYLSMYIDGCRQGLHNDAKNGLFAFVYSLTKNDRKTSGGETIILNEGDLFRDYLTTPAAGHNFYTEVAPQFNRLVIFDDRIPHGVAPVEGPMDPIEGRFVLHGHIVDSGPIVEGALSEELVGDAVIEAMEASSIQAPENITKYHGPLVMRFVIGSDGAVRSDQIIVDRVIGPRDRDWEEYVQRLAETRRAIKFPPSNGITTVTEPIIFGTSDS